MSGRGRSRSGPVVGSAVWSPRWRGAADGGAAAAGSSVLDVRQSDRASLDSLARWAPAHRAGLSLGWRLWGAPGPRAGGVAFGRGGGGRATLALAGSSSSLRRGRGPPRELARSPADRPPVVCAGGNRGGPACGGRRRAEVARRCFPLSVITRPRRRPSPIAPSSTTRRASGGAGASRGPGSSDLTGRAAGRGGGGGPRDRRPRLPTDRGFCAASLSSSAPAIAEPGLERGSSSPSAAIQLRPSRALRGRRRRDPTAGTRRSTARPRPRAKKKHHYRLGSRARTPPVA